MNFIKRPNKKGDKITFYYDFGRGTGQRPSTGIFIYTKPKDQIQRNHNKEALALLETKKSQLTIEKQAIGSAFIPGHKFKANFLEYYEEYVNQNKRKRNRHLANSLKQFKTFIDADFIAPLDITENFCKRFISSAAWDMTWLPFTLPPPRIHRIAMIKMKSFARYRSGLPMTRDS